LKFLFVKLFDLTQLLPKSIRVIIKELNIQTSFKINTNTVKYYNGLGIVG